jgi:hypothetical protein
MSKKEIKNKNLTAGAGNEEDDDDDDDDDEDYEPELKKSSDEEEEEDESEGDEEDNENESDGEDQPGKRKLGRDTSSLKKSKTEESDLLKEDPVQAKKAEDIWSCFLKDVGSTAQKKPTDSGNAPASNSTIKKYDSNIAKTDTDNSNLKKFFSESTISKDLPSSARNEITKSAEATNEPPKK